MNGSSLAGQSCAAAQPIAPLGQLCPRRIHRVSTPPLASPLCLGYCFCETVPFADSVEELVNRKVDHGLQTRTPGERRRHL